MSVGFGFSVGDFFAALNLVGTVIDALRESGNASSSFRSLISELYTLESSLLRVKRLDLDDSHKVQQLALRQAASQCQRTIDNFWKKTQKYQHHLQAGATNSRLKVLLLTIQMEATTMHRRERNSEHKSLTSRIQEVSCRAMGKLQSIAGGVAHSIQQGKELLEASAQIVQTNLRVFQMVHDIQLLVLRILGQIQRLQPVYMTDPFNKESPFHLEFIRSPEALLAVLKLNLKETGCGPAMIDQGDFVIEELGTQTQIDINSSWDSCFYPGQKVAMSMVFKQLEIPETACPRRGQEHNEPAGKQINWYVLPSLYTIGMRISVSSLA
jgi:hypothetical protein